MLIRNLGTGVAVVKNPPDASITTCATSKRVRNVAALIDASVDGRRVISVFTETTSALAAGADPAALQALDVQ